MKITSILYIIPTPIGNYRDITLRALDILKILDMVVSENVRHTDFLLKHFNIKKPITLLNVINEKRATDKLILKLIENNGIKVGLVSKSGTPLISDPGFYLIKMCYKYNIKIVPLPGPCSIVTALSSSGISSRRFFYEGFLPKKRKKRRLILMKLSRIQETLIFFESPKRILETLIDMISIFGKNRLVSLSRELTKFWESIDLLTIKNLIDKIKLKNYQLKGEIILIVEGCRNNNFLNNSHISLNILDTLILLKQFCSLNKAIFLASKIYNFRKNKLYKYYLKYNKLFPNKISEV